MWLVQQILLQEIFSSGSQGAGFTEVDYWAPTSQLFQDPVDPEKLRFERKNCKNSQNTCASLFSKKKSCRKQNCVKINFAQENL